ncbi:MAG: hypothetical protein WBK55_00790 [Alphaproteobacteria bacterium]
MSREDNDVGRRDFLKLSAVSAVFFAVTGCGLAKQIGLLPPTNADIAADARKKMKAVIGELYKFTFDVRPNNHLPTPHWRADPDSPYFPGSIEIDPKNIRLEQMEVVRWVARRVSTYFEGLLADKSASAERIKELSLEYVERGAHMYSEFMGVYENALAAGIVRPIPAGPSASQ